MSINDYTREPGLIAGRILDELDGQDELREQRTWRGGARDEASFVANVPSNAAPGGKLAEEAVTKGASDALAVDPPLLEAFSRTAPREAMDALRGAHARLLEEFRKATGRNPTANDEPFWSAWRHVILAFNDSVRASEDER